MKVRYHGGFALMDAWHNVDDGEPIPTWMNDVACWLAGGRFAIETRVGTKIAELGDWIILAPDGSVALCSAVAFTVLYADATS